MATALIPPSFLFRYSAACRYDAKLHSAGSVLVRSADRFRLPFPGAMDGRREFARVWAAWNERGLGVAFEVRGKELPIHGEQGRSTASDGMSLWLDMRDARTAHRAGRFCQRFLLLAHDGSDSASPIALRKPIKRAAEEPPPIDSTQIRILRRALDEEGEILRKTPDVVKSYRIEAFLPADVLAGFDPENNRRLGFFYRVRDREFGDQIFSGAPELPYWEDPSLWAVLVLTS